MADPLSRDVAARGGIFFVILRIFILMLKRLLVLLLLGIYFTATSGMDLNFHFCGKNLAIIQINAAKIKSCCKTKPGLADRCCHNKSVKIKVANQHQAVATVQTPAAKSIALFYIANLFNPGSTISVNKFANSLLNKPPPPGVSIGLKNCVFRI